MISTRIDPAKLRSLAILLREGMEPRDIRTAMQISKATYERYRAELRRFEEAAKLVRSDS
jgi:hypothetical protein